MRYWLFKTEPGCFSLNDLIFSPNATTPWDGVRNYQARNLMRSMKIGDLGFFYHSGKQPEIAALVEVVREAYPDHTAQNPQNRHFDPKATPEDPRWYMVDVKLVRCFEPPIPLSELRAQPELEGMELLKRGSRLSVQPVEEPAFRYIMTLADRT
ncbi:EVE domain-containing protein [uncultured Mailhella sp.]|uniref:EVE domain-containing protein n=1 Tax=uncultured Mailhella sp. TaxID=1981031 RepID=UPI0026206DBB|nr:EVE domain-containing protein [uncultured Mailhella sp.]